MLMLLICAIIVVPSFIIATYHFCLAVVGLFPEKQRIQSKLGHRFAILIPAHNEENTLKRTLESCKKLNYPTDQYRVWVIADNCTDKTASIAIENYVECLIRYDSHQRGKGAALAWALPQVLRSSCDAVVIVDADCILSSNSLEVFDSYLADGNRVLQANNAVADPDASIRAYAISVANILENFFFYAPKSRLGLSVFLRGTGMVFHRSVLEKFPWQSNALTEDTEYSLKLIKHGVPITFVGTSKIESEVPPTTQAFINQRKRWVAGNFTAKRANALKLILMGFKQLNIRILDAGFTLLILSKPLVFTQIICGAAITSTCIIFTSYKCCIELLKVSIITCILYAIYINIGIFCLGVTRKRISLILGIPLVFSSLIYATVLGLVSRVEHWVRTERPNKLLSN